MFAAPMQYWLALATWLMIFSFALVKGARPERGAAIILISAMCIDAIYRQITGSDDFGQLDWMNLAIDSSVLIALGWIALRANRYWPLWITAMQAIPVVGHFAMLLEISGISGAYWAMVAIPFYLQILTLLIATILHRRRLRLTGVYPDWRRPKT